MAAGHRVPSLQEQVVAVCERVPEKLLARAILMGSAAIALRGVDLRREPGDIDLWVSRSTFLEWPEEGFARIAKNGIARIVIHDLDRVEIFAAFPGVTFHRVERRASVTDTSRGLRVAALEDLLVWKRAQKELRVEDAHRNKDAADIRAIEQHLRTSFWNR